jgi:predicted GH43/DUF377 family glycosyl hydrolase
MNRRGVWLFALLLCASHRAAAQEDGSLARSASNPLLTRGAAGAIDSLKIGPRAMLRLAPNDWRMWYEAVPSGNKSYCAYATSTDGISWTRYAGNPVMSPSAAWEGGANNTEGESSPTSVLREQGLFKLWYHGYANGTRQIGYATSPDGITWTKFAGNPVVTPGASGAWDEQSVCEPNVVHVGDTYYMYYSRCSGAGGIGLATSADGVTWSKYAGNPVIAVGAGWDSLQVDWGGVYHDGQQFHMWYLGHADAASAFSIGYASSSDGKTWVKSNANPVLTPPSPLIVSTDFAVNKGDGLGVENSVKAFRLGNTWSLYYGGLASCCPENAALDLATTSVKTSPNRAPQVEAGADQTIVLPADAMLAGTIMDDDVPVVLASVTAQWSKVSGPGAVTFSMEAARATHASFALPGTYVLRLAANDTALSVSADVTVTVLAEGSDASVSPVDLATANADGANAGDAGPQDLGTVGPSSGCGCSLASRPPRAGWLLVGALLLALAARRRTLG